MWFKNWWVFLFTNYAQIVIKAKKNYSSSSLAFIIIIIIIIIFNWRVFYFRSLGKNKGIFDKETAKPQTEINDKSKWNCHCETIMVAFFPLLPLFSDEA